MLINKALSKMRKAFKGTSPEFPRGGDQSPGDALNEEATGVSRIPQ